MKYTFSILVMLCLVSPISVFAQFEITEIMYDPEGSDAGREWIEILNTSGSPITITGGTVKDSWRLFEESASGNLSKRTFYFGEDVGSITVPAHSYMVVANEPNEFLVDFPNFNGVLVRSRISLTNSEGRKLVLVDGGGSERSDKVLYEPEPGASNTGASLQRQVGGDWIAGLPTPGEPNTTVPFEVEEKNDSSGNASVSKDEFSNLESAWPFNDGVVYVNAGENRRVFVGQEVKFAGEARFRNGDEPRRAKFSWAFGDGRGDKGRDTKHSYKKSGTYSVVLTVEDEGKVFRDRIKIQVIDREVISLGEVESEQVEVVNSTDYEIELTGWSIEGGEKSMKLATGTHILPKSTIYVPYETGLASAVRLTDSSGKLASEVVLKNFPANLSKDSEEIVKKIIEVLLQIQRNINDA